MRIALVTDGFPPSWGGGIASSHYHLFRLLASQGHEVRAFAVYDRADDQTIATRRALPLKWDRLIRRVVSRLFRWIDSCDAAYQTTDILLRGYGAWKLDKEIRDFRPEIVILPDHGAPGLFIRRHGRERRVLIAHHNPSRFLTLPGIESHSRSDIRTALFLESLALRSMDAVICPSAYMLQCFRESFDFTGPVEVCHNIVDQEWLDAVPAVDIRQKLGLHDGDPLILFPAGGNKFKGSGFVEAIVKGACDIWPGSIGICITGTLSRDLQDRLAAIAPGRLRLHAPGPLDGPANAALTRACSFAISPSLVENFSMALLECVLCGVPALAFDVGGNRELIRDGVNGFLAPFADTDALIQKMSRLKDNEARSRLRASTLADAHSRLCSDVAGPVIVNSLLGERVCASSR